MITDEPMPPAHTRQPGSVDLFPELNQTGGDVRKLVLQAQVLPAAIAALFQPVRVNQTSVIIFGIHPDRLKKTGLVTHPTPPEPLLGSFQRWRPAQLIEAPAEFEPFLRAQHPHRIVLIQFQTGGDPHPQGDPFRLTGQRFR